MYFEQKHLMAVSIKLVLREMRRSVWKEHPQGVEGLGLRRLLVENDLLPITLT